LLSIQLVSIYEKGYADYICSVRFVLHCATGYAAHGYAG
jgi:hypothetical protein